MTPKQQPDTGTIEGAGTDSLLGYRAAMLHYVERKNNLTIAKEMGVSRFRVARLLDQAVETGAVKISISAPFGEDTELGDRLRKRFGLKQALVVPADVESDSVVTKRSVAALAATFLQQSLTPGAVVGVSWGTTLDAVAYAADALSTDFERCDLVQMFGGIPTLRGSLHASELLRRFSVILRGTTYALQAPLVVPTIETAVGLRSEESVARTLAMVRKVDIAVLGLGSWDPASSGLMDVLPDADVEIARAAGVLADVCGILIDRDGNIVAEELSRRMMSASLEDVRVIPLRLAIATGTEKAAALRAAFKADVINGLVTDAATAAALLTH
jgi:DNA-binding transcriptional regulator LsrR (DeoR family)